MIKKLLGSFIYQLNTRLKSKSHWPKKKDIEVCLYLYTDDTQINRSVNIENIQYLKLQTEECIKNVKNWMNVNKLKLNDNKTEVILCHSPRHSIQGMSISLNINGNEIKNSCKIRNLGVIFDENLSMSDQVTSICQKSYFQLRKIASVWNYLTEFATTILVTTWILLNLDYCNSSLSGITNHNFKKLQSIQNCAAKLIKRKKKIWSCYINSFWSSLATRWTAHYLQNLLYSS